jgi:hypothetical protein
MPWVTAPKLKAGAGHQGILTGTANVTLFPDMGQRRAATMKECQLLMSACFGSN